MNRIETLHLIPGLDARLLDVLDSLSAAEWERETVAPGWTVKDVAAHLLDVSLRTISLQRDGHSRSPEKALQTYDDLVAFLNETNRIWVEAAKRLSPRVLLDLLAYALPLHHEALAALDPDAPAPFSVAWAGETESKTWFHIAREYTEKFHHQMQIRHATGREGDLLDDRFYKPFLDTSVLALPHHYRNVEAREGACVRIHFSGAAPGYDLRRLNGVWTIGPAASAPASAGIQVERQIAWRIFTRGIPPAEARMLATVSGDPALTEPFFTVLAVIASRNEPT